jgi:hypothetical protein
MRVLSREQFERKKAAGIFNLQFTYEDYLAMRRSQDELARQQRAEMNADDRALLEKNEAEFFARRKQPAAA